jgi:hypothetical protein
MLQQPGVATQDFEQLQLSDIDEITIVYLYV